ncbi:MAG: DinB family protein, partial [Thermoanaerobaculia bacterium]
LEYLYRVTGGLFDQVDDGDLGWKPATGENWMTTGQLLHHIATGNGPGFKGFVTGDWGMPEGMDLADMSPEEMLPPAEKMPSVVSVEQAMTMLAEDQTLAAEVLAGLDEEELATRELAAPWNPGEAFCLGRHLLHSIRHTLQHKGQLFYYLKLQGKAVNTQHLWGM